MYIISSSYEKQENLAINFYNTRAALKNVINDCGYNDLEQFLVVDLSVPLFENLTDSKCLYLWPIDGVCVLESSCFPNSTVFNRKVVAKKLEVATRVTA